MDTKVGLKYLCFFCSPILTSSCEQLARRPAQPRGEQLAITNAIAEATFSMVSL